jgi:hypothetical protein
MTNERGKSDRPIVCAEQRVVREGWSPSGAQMRGAISKSGGNASLAGECGGYGDAHTGTKAKAGNSQGGPGATARAVPRRAGCPGRKGGPSRTGNPKGLRRSTGPQSMGALPDDEPVGQRVGQGRVCTMETKAFSFTHRTKVYAGGTVRKNSA